VKKSTINTSDFKSNASIKHGDKLILLGSCFSDNMASVFQDSGFNVLSNPFGTVYHPLAIAESISDALDNANKTRIFNREDVWLDWRASSTVYAMSEKSMHERMTALSSELRTSLLTSKLLVITFGTAWGYFIENGDVVANCHKMPGNLFDKRLVSLSEMKSVWQKVIQRLQRANPNLTIAFTVSPIDHLKDGVVENSRSKARLIELCHDLKSNTDAEYFHSYELVKYYLPNSLEFNEAASKLDSKGVSLVWQHASSFFLDQKALLLATEVQEINRMKNHRSIHPESSSALKFREKVKEKQESLSKKHPEIFWKQ